MNTHEYKKESQKNKFMKCSLEKWGRAPIILRVHEHPLFWGLEHSLFRRARAPIFKRARALIISRGHSCTE